MSYTHDLTAFCPAALIEKGNHLAAAIGLSLADLNTFRENYQGWAVCNARVQESVAVVASLAGTGFQLPRPEWDVEESINMAWAQEVFDGMTTYVPVEGESFSPVGFVIAFNQNVHSLVSQAGLISLGDNNG